MVDRVVLVVFSLAYICCACRAQIIKLSKNVYFYYVQIHKICRFIRFISDQVLLRGRKDVKSELRYMHIGHAPKCRFRAYNPLKQWIIKKNYVTLTVCNYYAYINFLNILNNLRRKCMKMVPKESWYCSFEVSEVLISN